LAQKVIVLKNLTFFYVLDLLLLNIPIISERREKLWQLQNLVIFGDTREIRFKNYPAIMICGFCVFVNSAHKIQCPIVKNTLLQTAISPSAILPTRVVVIK